MPTISPLGHGQIRSFRMPADFWLRRADRCREQNQPLRAITILRHAMQLEPDDAELRLEYADELRSLDCYEASNRECYELLAKQPACFAAFGLLAQNLLSLGKASEAMDAYAFYAQYARVYPEELPAWDDELYEVEDALSVLPMPRERVRLGALLRAAGRRIERDDLARAKELLLRSQRKPFPRRVPQRDALWALYFLHARKPERARAHALSAIKAAPDEASLLLPMAMVLNHQKDTAAAPALLRAAMKARTPEDELSVCVAAAQMKRDSVALSMLGRSLRRYPNRMSSVFNQCVFKLRAGDLAAAVAPIHRLREIDPDDPSVERLFMLINQLSEENAPPERVREAGASQPFFGVPDARVTAGALRAFYTEIENGVESFAARLVEERAFYRAFLSLLRLDPALHKLLSPVCAALSPKDAAPLLRHVLLLGLDDQQALRNASVLLSTYGFKPPYLVRARERLTLLDPFAKPPVTPSFLQRMIYRRLRELYALCGEREALLFALRLLPRMGDPVLFRLAGDFFKVWPSAIWRIYCKEIGAEPPALDAGLLRSKRRMRAWARAVSAADKAAHSKKETKSHGTD